MKIIIYSAQYYEKDYFNHYNKGRHYIIYTDERLTAETTGLAVQCKAVCVLVHDKIDSNVLQLLKNAGVEIIALRSAGYDNVDLKAAQETGIKITNVPAYSPEAVAEHAVALLLTLSRKTHKSYLRVKANNFSLLNLMGYNLHDKTVGVIGTGRIGAAFCRIMLGFGCIVIAYDIKVSHDLEKLGVRYVDKITLFKKSDIISLHCPLNKETIHLLNSKAIAIMKRGVTLINTSRGGVVDTEAVISGLESGAIGFFGTDVYEKEAGIFFKDLSESYVTDEQFLKLSSFSNVLITPHQGFFTKEAVEEIIAVTLQNITEYEQNLPLTNEVRVLK